MNVYYPLGVQLETIKIPLKMGLYTIKVKFESKTCFRFDQQPLNILLLKHQQTI